MNKDDAKEAIELYEKHDTIRRRYKAIKGKDYSITIQTVLPGEVYPVHTMKFAPDNEHFNVETYYQKLMLGYEKRLRELGFEKPSYKDDLPEV